jgi:hypothetical protein
MRADSEMISLSFSFSLNYIAPVPSDDRSGAVFLLNSFFAELNWAIAFGGA